MMFFRKKIIIIMKNLFDFGNFNFCGRKFTFKNKNNIFHMKIE